MKLVKLNKTHSLYHKGFPVAFRFDSYSIEASRIERMLYQKFGSQHKPNAVWQFKLGHQSKVTKRRIVWIGIKTESMATMFLLSLHRPF